MKLITLPFAGGTATYYNNWKIYFYKKIELVSIELAGRGNRINKPVNQDINDMVENIFDILIENINDEFMIFGHSMGALLAYELAVKLKKNNRPSNTYLLFRKIRPKYIKI